MLENFRKLRITLSRANEAVYRKIIAKEGDVNGRELEVQLINNGIVEDLSAINLRLDWKNLTAGNSGMHTFEAVDKSKGLFKISYPPSMLNKGSVTASIAIMEGSKRITNTRNFTIIVEKSGVDAQTVIASDDFQALNDALIQINKYQAQIDGIKADIRADADDLIESERIRIGKILDEIEPRLDGLESQLDDAISNVTVDSEVITARSSTATGKNYTTLSNRLDDTEETNLLKNLDTNKKSIISLEIKNGQPRLRMEEI